ncbi:MAG: hypothetical protein ACJAYU_001086 [Bradymonadia bacterium]|jgi:hypothetical protein
MSETEFTPQSRFKSWRRFARWFTPLLTLPVATIGGMAVAFVGGTGPPSALRIILAILFGLMVIFPPLTQKEVKKGLGVTAVLFGIVVAWWTLEPASNERNWYEPQARTPWAEIDGDLVTIHDVRDFRWDDPPDTWEARWYDATYDLSQLEASYFILSRFTENEGVAHVMASFRFAGDQFVVLSVEIRREAGESYSPIRGLFRQYEIMYVAADERDALALRSNHWSDDTYVFPVNAGQEKSAEFFMAMIYSMNDVHESADWYNTLTNSCSTVLANHFEEVSGIEIPMDHRVLMPGFSDQIVEELGLLEDGLSAEEARERYFINPAANAVGVTDTFSTDIRTWDP